MEESKWFGLKLNFKWPHEGFCLGFSIDYFDADEGLPWESIVFRVLFLTVIYDYGWGDDSREMYDNQ
jgi:hypothetical protein